MGGRFRGMLITKDGRTCNTAKVCDLDLEAMRQQRLQKAETWWLEAQNEDAASRRFLYDIDSSTTREQYLARFESLSTFAVLMNGQWYERGRMGWWGTVSAAKGDAEWQEEFKKLIAALPGDARVTVVDCHI